jgi:serine/threonine protein kinase
VDRLQPGDPGQIGPFRLLGRLGEGGMGRVFQGASPGGRKVAIKIVHPHYANDPEFRRRFAREVAAARLVGGFHAALVVDADPDADPPWMATAYIPGPSLTDAVARRGPLDEAGVRELGAGLAEGLAAIHACGLIHRDLKPGNVILADDGPRIIDFGIAKGADATELTASHAVIGSLRYMSPEQLNGQELTPQSDVFALGTILAYAATGHDPFGAPTVPAVINHILNDPPDLDPLTGELRGIIGECLAKDPASRPTPGDLLARFSHPEAHDPTVIATPASVPAAVPVPAPEPAPAPMPVPAAEPVPAAAPPPEPPPAGSGEPERPPVQEPSQDSTINVPIAGRQQPAQPRTTQAGDAAAPARTPQPRRYRRRTGLIAAGVTAAVALAVVVAFALDQHPTKTLSATGTHPSNSPSAPHSRPAVSPPPPADSPSATGSLTRIFTDPVRGIPVNSVAFAPDGTTLATGDSNGRTYLWNTKTGKITATLTDPASYGVLSVVFAPDGSTLATGDGNGNTYLWNTRTGKITATLTQPASYGGVASAAFAPHGTTLATGDDGGSTYLWNTRTGKITATLTQPASAGVFSVAFAPDGATLAVGDYESTYLWSLATHKITATLTDSLGSASAVNSVAFSPGGITLAVGNEDGSTYLWSLATHKITATLTGPASGAVDSVVFAPDGTTLATADGNGNAHLWHITYHKS